MRLRTTAPPRRLEVTNPARHEPEFFSGIAFNIRSLPRCVIPFRFTRSYSRRCVRRRVFGKENELTFVVYVATIFPYRNELPQDAVAIRDPTLSTKEVFHRKIGGRLQRIPALLRGGRLGRCLLGGSRCISGGSGRFRCSGTSFSRGWRRGRGSWTCRRSDSFSFLFARCEKRAHGQNADVFLHS